MASATVVPRTMSQPITPHSSLESIANVSSIALHSGAPETSSSAPTSAAPVSSTQSAAAAPNMLPAHPSATNASIVLSLSVATYPNTTPSPIPSPPVTPLGSPCHSPTRRGHSISTVATPASNTANDLAVLEPPVSIAASPSGLTSSNSRQSSGRKRQARPLTDAPVAKRRRTSIRNAKSAPTTESTSPLPDAPTAASLQAKHEWFAKAVEMLNDNSLGERWAKLVAAWIAFEVHFKCVPNGLLPCKGRPPAVGDYPGWRPIIVDSKIFGDAHVKWWTYLQPEWRVLDDDIFDRVDAGDLKCLKKPGANGLLSILASLFFWGTAVKAAGKKSERWNVYVEDFTLVLEHLSSTA